MTVHDSPATFNQVGAARVLEYFQGLDMISAIESAEVLSLFASDFVFADALRAAESVHVHIKVEDTRALPHEVIRAHDVAAENETDGYVKYPFPGGLNMIFSSIAISEDDLLVGEPAPELPVMDHLGIDLRSETAPVQAVFDATPEAARNHGWRHVPQGGAGVPVYCCHTEVKGKHWVYPPATDAAHTRPIEIAFGELEIHGTKMGCDLRPIDPAHPRAAEACATLSACAAAPSPHGAATNSTCGSSYSVADAASPSGV